MGETREYLRGVRGAIQVGEDDAAAIIDATEELLRTLIAANGIQENEVTSIFFSATADLRAAYPAQAARRLGWRQVALFGTQEQSVDDALPRVVRILIHWQTTRSLTQIQHVYLGEAATLRPDLVAEEEEL